jgi:hypothetical protein
MSLTLTWLDVMAVSVVVIVVRGRIQLAATVHVAVVAVVVGEGRTGSDDASGQQPHCFISLAVVMLVDVLLSLVMLVNTTKGRW